jgi:septum formation protein
MANSPAACLPPLILASQSPRRRALLAAAGFVFEVIAPDDAVERGVCSQCGAAELVAELALHKAAAIHAQVAGDPNRQGQLILAADTVAECDGFILGKPRDEEDARHMLRRLSGREHRVYSGICLWKVGTAEPRIRVAETRLRMDDLTQQELDDYIASGQWEGKAGAFGYQDRLGWVHIIHGSETNVVGLPMEMLAEMLAEAEKGSGE